MFYDKLTMEQVASTYTLIKFLRRLRVIGTLKAHTAQAIDPINIFGNYDIIDMTGADYSIVKDSYTPERSIDAEELLEQIYGRIRGPQYRGTH